MDDFNALFVLSSNTIHIILKGDVCFDNAGSSGNQKMTQTQSPKIAGWRERIDIPQWGLRRVRAKLDTGARTSAIDVAQFEMIDEDHVRFEIVYRVLPIRKTRWVEAKCHRVTNVKPSHGKSEERVICHTRIRIGDSEFDAEIGLVCRKGMLCRMLIGRTALSGRFLVDSSRKYIITEKKTKT